MSGSSLDGLDIVHVQLENVRGNWSCSIIHAACTPYSDTWASDLRDASTKSVPDFLRLHTAYGRYLGEQVKAFIEQHDLEHQVHFIASHGHTVFHDPHNHTTAQIGDGAAIAAVTGLPVISDLRAMDVALGGQGAPIVPIGDKLLFADNDYLLNIGGIANITIQGNEPTAYDICPANQILNMLASREGKAMDEGGAIAEHGKLIPDLLEQLNANPYYTQTPPKSLSNEAAKNILLDLLPKYNDASTPDLLHTVVAHIAGRVSQAAQQNPHNKEHATMLITGGGALNTFLISEIQKQLSPLNVFVTIPDAGIINYKEALVMALIGTLRWREEVNVLSSVTGASRDSIGGALWLP